MYDTRGVRAEATGAGRRHYGFRSPKGGADDSDAARGDAPPAGAAEGSSSGDEPAEGSNRAAKRPMPDPDSDAAKKRVASNVCPRPGCGKYKGHVGRHRVCREPMQTEEGGSGSDDTAQTEGEGQTDGDPVDLSDRAGATEDESDRDPGTSRRPRGATSVHDETRCPVWGCVKRAKHCGRHMVRLPDGSRPPRVPRVDVSDEQEIVSPPISSTSTTSSMKMVTRRKGVRGPPAPGIIDDFDVDGDDPLAGTPFEHGIASAVFAPPPAHGAFSARLRLNGQLDCGDDEEAEAGSSTQGEDMEGEDVTEGDEDEEGAEGEDVMDHDGAMAPGHRTIDEMLVAMDTPLATAACTDGAPAALMSVLQTSSPQRCSPLEMEMEHRLEGAGYPGVGPNASLADIAAAVAGVGPDGSASGDAISGWIDGLFGEVDSFDPNSASPFGARYASSPFGARHASSPLGARQQRLGDEAQPKDPSSVKQSEGSAADARHAASQRNLGMLLLRLNRPRDAVQALRSAASRGDDDAVRTLAQLDEESGVPRQPAGPSTAAAATSPATRPPAQVAPLRQAPAPTGGAPAVEEAPGTSAQAIAVGTRLAVLWTHGWEDGTVIKVTVRNGSRRFTVAYDDGEVHDEDLLDPEEWRILKGVARPQCLRHPECTLAPGHKGFCNKRRGVEQVAPQAPPPVPPVAPPVAAASSAAAPARASEGAKATPQGGGTQARKRTGGRGGRGGGSSSVDAMTDYDQHMSQKHGMEPSMSSVRVQDLACTPPQMLGPLRNVVASMKQPPRASGALPSAVAPVRLEPGRCDSDSTASTEPNDMELGAGNTSPVSASATSSSAAASASTLAQALPPDMSGERPLLPRAAVLAS